MNTEEIKLPKNKQETVGIFRKRPKYDEEGNRIYYKKKKLIKSRVNRSVGGDIAMVLFLLIAGVFMAFPMIYAISNSFKPLHELWLFPPNLIVKNPTGANYRDMFTILSNSTVPFTRYLFNTLFITVGATFLRVISASMAGAAGSLFVMNYTTMQASKFDFNTSILVLVFVVLGGLGNMRGSIVAATLLTVLPELLRAVRDYRMLLYAVVLIVVMLATHSAAGRQMTDKISGKIGAVFDNVKYRIFRKAGDK